VTSILSEWEDGKAFFSDIFHAKKRRIKTADTRIIEALLFMDDAYTVTQKKVSFHKKQNTAKRRCCIVLYFYTITFF